MQTDMFRKNGIPKGFSANQYIEITTDFSSTKLKQLNFLKVQLLVWL